MNSEDLALLLGVLGGGVAGHFGSKRRHDRERAEKKEDRQERLDFARQMRDEDRAYKKQIEGEEKAEAEKYDAEHYSPSDLWDWWGGIKKDSVNDFFTDPSSKLLAAPFGPSLYMGNQMMGDPYGQWIEGGGPQNMWKGMGEAAGKYMYNEGGRIEYNQGGIVDLYKKLNRGK